MAIRLTTPKLLSRQRTQPYRHYTYTLSMVTPNEIEHEQQLVSRGRNELARLLNEAEEKNYYSSTLPGRALLQTYLLHLSKTLDAKTAHYEGVVAKGTSSRTLMRILCCQMREYIDLLSPDILAMLTLKAIEDSYGINREPTTVADLSSTLGNKVKDEVRVAWYDKQDPAIGEVLRKSASMPGSTPIYRRKRTRQVAKKLAAERQCEEFDDWTYRHTCDVGEYLLEVAYYAGICNFRNIKLGTKKQQKIIVFTEGFHNMLLTYEKSAFDNAYENHPLIDLPLDWQQSEEPGRYNRTGGYHLPQLRRRQSMCRGKGIHDSVFGAKSAAMQNTLQRTAWRIDSRVLDVAEKLSEGHKSIGKFLVIERERPEKGNAPEHYLDDTQKMKEWRSMRAAENRAYGEDYRRSVRTRKAMCMAREYRHKTFYLSWFVDWRGRFYCQQSWLAPVGATDFEKSLLKFRDGCKVTEQAMRWIYSAIGSAFKGTKISTNERIRWTVDNKSLIEDVANDPLDTVEIWSTADEPWTFLQLCFEWNDVVVTKKESFWKVPLQIDSTASGLQLLSGMRRDPVGMTNTNLLPPDTADSPPEDAYIKVLANAKAIAEQKDQKHLIKYLQFRSVGKPVVMTAIYGAKAFSFKQKIEDALIKAAENGELCEDELPTDAVLWELASLIHQATKQVFPAAFQALEWLRRLAKAAHENGSQSLVWKTPTNDTIHLVKFKHESTEIYTSFNGKIIFSDYDKEKVNYTKEVSSFIPAVVHSYDAALLKESFSDWQHPLSVIHDCVLVLPNDMDRAMERIREGFVSIVDGDPLAKLADDLGVDSTSLKRLSQGEQSLDSVYQSKYMFN